MTETKEKKETAFDKLSDAKKEERCLKGAQTWFERAPSARARRRIIAFLQDRFEEEVENRGAVRPVESRHLEIPGANPPADPFA